MCVISETLKSVFHHEELGNSNLFSRKNKKLRQRWIFLKIQEIFINFEIHESRKIR